VILEEAARAGEVRIRRRDGKSFVIRPEQPSRSSFGIEGVDLGLKREQILRAIHDCRRK
jgi:hypothetical protein